MLYLEERTPEPEEEEKNIPRWIPVALLTVGVTLILIGTTSKA